MEESRTRRGFLSFIIENSSFIITYNPRAALDIEEISVQFRNSVKVQDISYANPLGGRVTAYLVTPPGKGPFAGMIFLHDPPADRAQFMGEAVMLAQTGVMSLLIDAPFRRPAPWRQFPKLTQPEVEVEASIQLVIDLRRGVDLLTSRAEVDANRIGYAGFSSPVEMVHSQPHQPNPERWINDDRL